jgi:hypothetical protein
MFISEAEQKRMLSLFYERLTFFSLKYLKFIFQN